MKRTVRSIAWILLIAALPGVAALAQQPAATPTPVVITATPIPQLGACPW